MFLGRTRSPRNIMTYVHRPDQKAEEHKAGPYVPLPRGSLRNITSHTRCFPSVFSATPTNSFGLWSSPLRPFASAPAATRPPLAHLARPRSRLGRPLSCPTCLGRHRPGQRLPSPFPASSGASRCATNKILSPFSCRILGPLEFLPAFSSSSMSDGTIEI
jgi:hypothetical protein